MKKCTLQILLWFVAFIAISGCSIPKRSYTLVPPPELTQNDRNKIRKECMIEAKNNSNILLTENELNLIINIETARFFEGGRGRNAFSDRYVLCFLNNEYTLLEL